MCVVVLSAFCWGIDNNLSPKHTLPSDCVDVVARNHRLGREGRPRLVASLGLHGGTLLSLPIRDLHHSQQDATGVFLSAHDCDMLLRRLGVGIVVFVGVATNGCVLATALDAYFRDYWAVVPSDCVEAETKSLNEAGLTIVRYLIGPTLSSSSVMRFFRYYRTDEVDPRAYLIEELLVRRRHPKLTTPPRTAP